MKPYFVIFLHVIIWLFLTGLVLIYDLIALTYMDSREGTLLPAMVIGTAINAFLFYFNSLKLFPLLIDKKIKPVKYGIYIIAIWFVCSCGEGFIDFGISRWYYPFLNIKLDIEFFDLNMFFNFAFILLSFGFGFAKEWFRNQQAKQQLFEEKTLAELAFLKSQVNPHFLFNTLNNLFALARKQRSETAEGIAKLAHLMRYMLYESSVEEIELEKELEYLENFINLQKLRFIEEDDIEIRFAVKGHIKEVRIPPLLLIPLVENAFKHGISLNRHSYIFVELIVEPQQLSLSVKNSINSKNSGILTGNSGIGIQNLQKRLELIYPDKYSLKITRDTTEFMGELRINLK